MMRVVFQPAQLGVDRGIVLASPALQPVDERVLSAAFAQLSGRRGEDGVSGTEALEERAQARGVQPGRADEGEPGGE